MASDSSDHDAAGANNADANITPRVYLGESSHETPLPSAEISKKDAIIRGLIGAWAYGFDVEDDEEEDAQQVALHSVINADAYIISPWVCFDETTPFPSAEISVKDAIRRGLTQAAGLDLDVEDDDALQVALRVPGRSILMLAPGREASDFLFFLDSGAAVNATPRHYLLTDMVPVASDSDEHVRAANGKKIRVFGRGRVSLQNYITLEDVHYIPGLTHNLVSVSKLTELGYTVQFSGTGCFVMDATAGGSPLVGSGRLTGGGLYELDYLLIPQGRRVAAAPPPPQEEA